MVVVRGFEVRCRVQSAEVRGRLSGREALEGRKGSGQGERAERVRRVGLGEMIACVRAACQWGTGTQVAKQERKE